ncbi:hypothetical protein V1514DRAFT_148655 [Lipomyces japonicus]|uniref:uncharacterized protein n=1 Tax=Lipomyces japonicus TaxID=56871 RepID=UPI0034CE18AA
MSFKKAKENPSRTAVLWFSSDSTCKSPEKFRALQAKYYRKVKLHEKKRRPTVGNFCEVLYAKEFDLIRSSIAPINGQNYLDMLPDEIFTQISKYVLFNEPRRNINWFIETCNKFREMALSQLPVAISTCGLTNNAFLLMTKTNPEVCQLITDVCIMSKGKTKNIRFELFVLDVMAYFGNCTNVQFHGLPIFINRDDNTRAELCNIDTEGFKKVVKCSFKECFGTSISLEYLVLIFSQLKELELDSTDLTVTWPVMQWHTQRPRLHYLPKLSTIKFIGANSHAIDFLDKLLHVSPYMEILKIENGNSEEQLLIDWTIAHWISLWRVSLIDKIWLNGEGVLSLTQEILTNPGRLATDFVYLDIEVLTQQMVLSKHWELRELTMEELKPENILSEFYNALRDVDRGVSPIKDRGPCFEIDNEKEMKFLPVNDSQSLVYEAPQIIVTFLKEEFI